jgi:predicted GNAT family acetyltransferase
MYDELILTNNTTENRFEITLKGQKAFISYRKIGNTFLLIHTEVPNALQDQGIAAALVEKTFKYLEENHLKMRPYCTYVQFYLKKHPEWTRIMDRQ